MIGSTTRVLTWDETDRLKSVAQNGGVLARYQYNPDGERTQKQDAVGNTTSFYFNQFLVINGSRQMTKSLFAGDTRIASKTESAQLTTPVRSFYHPDNVGSTSYISNASQTLVQHERYFPTGERWSSPNEVVTTGNIQRDYLFTGKELDRDTGFYYYGARYLDPRTSNWLSTDPILGTYMRGKPNGGVFNPQNLSLYSYAWNNPFRMNDPNGLAPGDIERALAAGRITLPEAMALMQARGVRGVGAGVSGLDTSGVWNGASMVGTTVALVMLPGGALVLRTVAMGASIQHVQKYLDTGDKTELGRGFVAFAGASLGEETPGALSAGGGSRGLVNVLRARVMQAGGFSGQGTRIIVDESIEIVNRGAAEALRGAGYDARGVTEIFGKRGVSDAAIRDVADAIDARVLTLDRGRDALSGGGFGKRAIQVDARATSTPSLMRTVKETQ